MSIYFSTYLNVKTNEFTVIFTPKGVGLLTQNNVPIRRLLENAMPYYKKFLKPNINGGYWDIRCFQTDVMEEISNHISCFIGQIIRKHDIVYTLSAAD